MFRTEILIYDKKKKRDITIYRDIYTLKEMIKTMKNINHCLFLIEALGEIWAYSEDKMHELEKSFNHCMFFDRKIMMINEE